VRTFVFKAYNNKKKNNVLHNQINIAGCVWNHCIALHKRYYRLFGKHLHPFHLMKHITKLKKLPRYAFWKNLDAQAIQDVVDRIERSYQLFFGNIKKKSKRKVNPPSFKKVKKYKSITLKQTGYGLQGGNTIRIGKKLYRFFKSRDIVGRIKTLTIKRDALGDIYLVFVTDAEHSVVPTTTGKTAGADFSMKDFLVLSDGTIRPAPQPLKKLLAELKAASKKHSKKKKGSKNRDKARLNLVRVHRKIKNQRRDFHFKLGRSITQEFEIFCIEDLCMAGMKALWGRKISDLGFADFVEILKFQSTKTTCRIVKVDRWFPSSKTCNCCKHINKDLTLRDRTWICPACGVLHDRDLNAAKNIHESGVGIATLERGDVRPEEILAVAA